MVGLLTLPEREVREVFTSKGLLKKTMPAPLVAIGVHGDAQIDLYRLSFEGKPQTSVFVYDSKYDLNPGCVVSLDPRFSEVSSPILRREFDEVSVEELDRLFLGWTRRESLMSFMDHPYPLHRPPIFEHSYYTGSEILLQSIIEELDPKIDLGC